MTDDNSTNKPDELTSWPPVPHDTGAALIDALAAYETAQDAALQTAESAHEQAIEALRTELAAQRSQFRNQLQVVFAGGPGDDDG